MRRVINIMILIFLSTVAAQGQIKIGGNVYGGGNKGKVAGNTNVTVKAVEEVNNVFGGARMADVGGHAFVHIDGEEATGDILIPNVFGGNDIAGTIGSSTVPVATYYSAEEAAAYNTAHGLSSGDPGYKSAGDLKESGLTEVLKTGETKETHPEKNAIDDSWNAFVRTSRSTKTQGTGEDAKTVEDKWILVGSLYGGGNGEYYYNPVKETTTGTGTEAETTVTYDVYFSKADFDAGTPETKRIATITQLKGKTPEPALGKTYLELKGGELAHVYGGGNNATVTENTTICINNESDNCQGYVTAQIIKLLTEDPLKPKEQLTAQVIDDLMKMSKLSSFQSNITSFEFNHARVFGGNNKADMAIRPTWNLQQGIIRDLYSGGNEGRMTSSTGLLLEIDPITAYKDKLVVENVFGGCRRSDVRPLDASGVDISPGNPEGYNFPAGLSARTLVRGGKIKNVYGGNDISGTVYGGNAVGIYTTVYGDVYGGGKGTYAYTDNPTLGAMDFYKDFYYNPEQVWKDAGYHNVDEMLVSAGYTLTDIGGWNDAKKSQMISAVALNQFRPNAEQVSIRLKGYPGNSGNPNYTTINRGVYCGGNSASINSKKTNPLIEIKFGSYVIADSVYLGNNGEKMVDPNILKLYAKSVDDQGNIAETGTVYDYSSLDLTDETVAGIFAEYMEGVVMTKQPDVVFDGDAQSDKDEDKYIENSSYVGSFFCGGNVGSMAIPGNNSYSISHILNIFEKFVGGCNNADIEKGEFNAAYEGGILGAKDERGANGNDYYTDDKTESGNIKDRLEINLENLTITPLRWQENENGEKTKLVWNTNKWSDENEEFIPLEDDDNVDDDTRLLGGNVYGGCYSSGHVNGNVVININEDLLKRDEVFGSESNGVNGRPASEVDLEEQRDDLNAVALSVFGAGFGKDTEIWGSTTVNLNKGYAFQIFGGGEEGVVGKGKTKTRTVTDEYGNYVTDEDGNYVTETYRDYTFDPRYSSTVNLSGRRTATSNTGKVDDLAETEFIYGGGNEGDVCGNTYVNLGNGRIYDAFGGASDADILGHSEVYIGRQPDNTPGTYKDGFPWIQDIVYGANDFGGTIHGKGNFKDRVRVETGEGAFDVLGKVHNPENKVDPDVLQANAYVEYLQGRVDSIFGGSYGYYDYTLEIFKDEDGNSPELPYLESTFVNIRPNNTNNTYNQILGVFGGGTGWPGDREGDRCQNRSYVLIDIPDSLSKFQTMEVFGAGSYNGMGMGIDKDKLADGTINLDQASTIIDLIRGKVGAAYGGSYKEGVTRRTLVNVPRGSTINIGSIFGGAYGNDVLAPCDVYEAHVNYNSADAMLIYNPKIEVMKGAIYGGNNSYRRTLYGFIDIDAPVWQHHPEYGITRGNVYGAGYGPMTWSEYTEVNLNKKPDGVEGDYTGAEVFEVYGGAQQGEVLNAESAMTFMNKFLNPTDQDNPLPEFLQTVYDERGYGDTEWRTKVWPDAWTLGKGYYTPYTYDEGQEEWIFTAGNFDDYATNAATNLSNPMVRTGEMDDRETKTYKYNTNVIIHEGAYVDNYAYGGGLGDSNQGTGDVYGTTYIALLGGKVSKDIYAAGTSGAVFDFYNSGEFIASTNAYIKGGTCRNVYGGGWKGSVGKHTKMNDAGVEVEAGIIDSPANDIYGETHVIIGDIDGTSFTNGIPAIQRNAYGGGEGGAVYGTANITINNGYIGYAHLLANQKFDDNGKIVAADASEGLTDRYEEKIIDETNKDKDSGAFIPNRNLYDAGCVFGGGYVDNSSVDKTHVSIYSGHIRNSVFGGGEVAAVGRGTIAEGTRALSLYRPGKTLLEMFGGHVHRNVFGGGRGYDNLGESGKLNADGCVFGQTEVHIHGGEVGTITGLADGDGNVFGGGDIGFVYSAYENTDGTFGKGVKIGERYGTDAHQGYYFKHTWADSGSGAGFIYTTNDENIFTEDCKVLIEPNCKSSADLEFSNIVYKKGTHIPDIDYNYLKEKDATNFAKIGTDHKATEDFTLSSREYPSGSYIPIAALNTLKDKNSDDTWNKLDDTGITIHNAVFAGGNTPSSSVSNANTVSVYGNATASIHDIFHRDMIMLGTRHTGGLYGDGNLTTVDGYRELNVTNYGTDYYSIAEEITINDYKALPKREADYYELRYTCLKECQDKEKTTYRPAVIENDKVISKASTISADEMQNLFVIRTYNDDGNLTAESSVTADGTPNGTPILIKEGGEWVPNPNNGDPYWKESGVLPVYAGRLMNSLQRADFCGVWGSRMVMQGAKDRIINKGDNTNYTINRVREVSLNKKVSTAGDNVEHGNYFGIYNIVHYLGALTSDVDFGDDNSRTYARTTNNTTDDDKYKCDANNQEYGTASFYDWKAEFHADRRRNNGSSYNKVALASGVYLELTTEESKGDSLYGKVWGPITGVVELDLINVSPGVGGGFVYAKNVHGVRKASGRVNTTLTALNSGAATQWDYIYNPPETLNSSDPLLTENDKKEWQTSGNFVHSTQTIIDDCYNISNKYKSNYLPPDGVPAHYWYIKGSVYVYDQYISAYTGSSNAFSETVDIPLTIAAASHGKMKLLDVQPNRYAYYSTSGVKLDADKKIIINDKTYYLNDPITYWDWYLLPASERALFVEKTYVNCVTYYDNNGVEHPAGTKVMTDTEFESYKDPSHIYNDKDGNPIQMAKETNADDEYIFRSSNNVSHETGYILTYEVTNPGIWDNWYTLKNGDYRKKIELAEYTELNPTNTVSEGITTLGKEAYHDGPTYRLDPAKLPQGVSGILLGQQAYKEGDLIAKEIVDTYAAIPSEAIPNPAETDPDYKEKKQASFEEAYIVTEKITVTEGSSEHNYNPGTAVSKTFAQNNNIVSEDDKNKAYICTHSIEITKEDIIYKGSKMTKKERDEYITDVETSMGNAYKSKTLEEIKALKTTGTGAITEEKKSQLIELAILRDDLKSCLVPAYYCTSDGKYGGDYYTANKNYRGLEAMSSMTKADRDMFTFNYDALDLLIDDSFSGDERKKWQYDGLGYDDESDVTVVKDTNGNIISGNPAGYSISQGLDYTASYNSNTASETLTNYVTVRHADGTTGWVNKLTEGDELTRDEFESKLLNEQRHYAAIVVKSGKKQVSEGNTTYTVYVANTSFVVGGTPYALGETIDYDTFKGLPLSVQSNVDEFVFPESDKDNTYYYCRESYQVTDHPVKSVVGNDNTYSTGEIVPVGTVIGTGNTTETVIGTGNTTESSITYYGYDNLPNEQKNFTIHGASPTETSTLFVSRESNIYDLSKEKIITVIYQYDYDENDASGNVTPVSERHVLNIHLKFESGVPTIDKLTPPDIILPGDFTILRKPDVKPGAYEISGYGWELFESPRDAESHRNGLEYDPIHTPLYWYQNDWQVAYYAETYLGRSYSNAVPVRVANYHDLAEVMSDENKDHHMYIDHTGVIRDPKIYINDYSEAGQNGLDLFKNLYDLSLRTTVATEGDLKDHALLNNRVRGGSGLEFFLRTDIDHSGPSGSATWTPIASGSSDPCFNGTFHGDGHTIKGLTPAEGTTGSLFGKLCGSVYNLGVTGSFTGAGIADEGEGYVESCWVKTTATTPLATKPYAVFGNPTDGNGYQLVNSYFWDGNKALYNINDDETTSGGDRGKATAKSSKAFYNGELTYDLNNFYLYKRYFNQKGTEDVTNKADRYLTFTDDNTAEIHAYTTYDNSPDLCSSGFIDNKGNTIKYVEDRFAYEDFRYAEGTIPTTKDDRYFTEIVKDEDGNDVEESGYYPIWPDDYIFFGQKLTYGYSNLEAHQDVPTAVAKTNGRLAQDESANRVYRAPAYYRSKDMGVAHFNPDVYLAQKEKLSDERIEKLTADNIDPSTVIRDAYPGMTAIDFAGHNGANVSNGNYGLGSVPSGSAAGTKWFYPPLLDDDGLLSITNCDETQNLLVYAPLKSTTEPNEYANEKTYTVLNRYFTDPDYSTYYKDPDGYRLVEEVNPSSVQGHLVQATLTDGKLTATNDHLLVDKQDFNAPIGYRFASGKRMWYQRTPGDDEYVTPEWTGSPAVRSTKGWQGISLPFTAELVTTHQKGEITHFYSGSETSKNNTDSKIGHEYWLRELDKIDGIDGNTNTVKANLTYPDATVGDKNYTNTFLWDYYYQNTAVHNHKDKNDDTYQTYYEKAHTHKDYPLLQGMTPYIIGFPGQTYYEFDLSGSFEAQNTAATIKKLAKQTITFASKAGISIGVSDLEMGGVTKNNYIFKPSYMNEEMKAGTFVLNSDGNAYTELSAVATTNTDNKVKTSQYAFRPYFVTAASTDGSRVTRSIIFSNDVSDLGKDQDQRDADKPGTLNARVGRRVIAVSSTLSNVATVRILNTAGQTLAEFDIQPGETVETRVNLSGVYVVQSADGHFTKKLSVR